LDSGFELVRVILLRNQSVQDIANDGERAVALRREPFLKGLRVEVQIGQKLATVGVNCGLQFGPVRRTGQPLEPVEVYEHMLQPTIGMVSDQVKGRARPERLAQLQQAIAKAVAGFFRPLVGP
jgi:hypothetical protein